MKFTGMEVGGICEYGCGEMFIKYRLNVNLGFTFTTKFKIYVYNWNYDEFKIITCLLFQSSIEWNFRTPAR